MNSTAPNHVIAICMAIMGLLMLAISNADALRTQPDTWRAVDALGRTTPSFGKVGPIRKDRFVGMFYFLWLGQHTKTGPYDISKILKDNPNALQEPENPAWGPPNAFHHWGEPLFGYYVSDDKWVFRKHAQMLSDAGVDTVIFDVTNQAIYPGPTRALCEAWQDSRKDGNTTPQIAYFCPFGDARKVARELYDTIYAKGLYKDLWFQWKGKPLLIADPATVDEDLHDFFTFRKSQSQYFPGPSGPDQWSWLEVYPQHMFKNSKGENEEMAVGVAQNAQDAKRLCAMSEPNVTGRSWHNGAKDLRPDAVNLGLNFQEQWDHALKADPEFIWVTGWNEWVAMRLDEFMGVKLPMMFVDQYNHEYSRDIEPMVGGHGDNYYYQLVDNIRRFKGAHPVPTVSEPKIISIDGRFDDWTDVKPDYRDDAGDTFHRNHPGWGSAGQYINNTGRNDIVQCKVARDNQNIYFYVRTRDNISPQTDPSWMRLFINIDNNPKSGWEGYSYVVNRLLAAKNKSVLETSESGWNWRKVTEIDFRVRGKQMELAIPRAALGLDSRSQPFEFQFKWADNMQQPNTDEFLLNGDTAPNSRFNYVYRE